MMVANEIQQPGFVREAGLFFCDGGETVSDVRGHY